MKSKYITDYLQRMTLVSLIISKQYIKKDRTGGGQNDTSKI